MESEKNDRKGSAQDPLLQVVSFTLGDEIFAIDILEVQEIIRTRGVTKVPDAPEFIEGVINLRGKVIPVVDLRKRFRFPIPDENEQERIIVLKMESKPAGIIVDSVSEVLRFPRESVEPSPSMITHIDKQSIYGVAKTNDRLLILLDVHNLLAITQESKL